MTLIELELMDLAPHQQEHYAQCLEKGCSPAMALMLASRQAAMMGGSDRSFNEWQRHHMSTMHEPTRDAMQAIAKKAGINTNGKYHAGIGRYDDPGAWCSTVDDVKDYVKAKNLHSDGLVKHKAVELPPKPPVRLAADIQQRLVQEELRNQAEAKGPAETGSARRKRVREVSEYVLDRYGGKKA